MQNTKSKLLANVQQLPLPRFSKQTLMSNSGHFTFEIYTSLSTHLFAKSPSSLYLQVCDHHLSLWYNAFLIVSSNERFECELPPIRTSIQFTNHFAACAVSETTLDCNPSYSFRECNFLYAQAHSAVLYVCRTMLPIEEYGDKCKILW